MSGELCFVDTNVLVYARDANQPAKQPRAAAWMAELWDLRCGRLSYQVLSEFYVTVTQKLKPGISPSVAREEIRNLASWKPTLVDVVTLERAFALQDRFQVSWWDALILASAQLLGCRYLLSEDFQMGQRFDEVEVINPFTTAPASIAG